MIAAADALSSGEHARVDGSRLCIVGGSAGGYTVLATLVDAKRPEVFAAGTSMYGISELVAVCPPGSCTRRAPLTVNCS
jgi:dipeptidyl aminopeptidase/acylaminoacyl peptidase